MYARVMSVQLKPKVADSAAVKDQIKNFVKINEAQKKMKGFRGAYAMIDRSANRYLTIVMWETEADMKATDLAHNERAKGVNGTLMVGPAITERYEIVAQV